MNKHAMNKHDVEADLIKKSVKLSVAIMLNIIAAAWVLPVSFVLAAPITFGAVLATGILMDRRLKRQLDALDVKALEKKT